MMWSIYGHPAAAFLRAIRPFLRIKARQADVACAWQDTVPTTLRRDENGRIVRVAVDRTIVDTLRQLKKAS